MDEEHAILLNEVRYGERLCQRTARLYRKAATAATFLSVVGGSAVLGALSERVPAGVSLAGALLVVVIGALNVAVRPAANAAAADVDMRRYSKLRTEASSMTATELRAALQRLRESDSAEIEPLRAVAYNDLVTEVGRDDWRMPLSRTQRLLALLA